MRAEKPEKLKNIKNKNKNIKKYISKRNKHRVYNTEIFDSDSNSNTVINNNNNIDYYNEKINQKTVDIIYLNKLFK